MLEAHVKLARAGQPDCIDRLWAGDVLILGDLAISIDVIDPTSMVVHFEAPTAGPGPIVLAPGDFVTVDNANDPGPIVATVTLMTIQEAPQC